MPGIAVGLSWISEGRVSHVFPCLLLYQVTIVCVDIIFVVKSPYWIWNSKFDWYFQIWQDKHYNLLPVEMIDNALQLNFYTSLGVHSPCNFIWNLTEQSVIPLSKGIFECNFLYIVLFVYGGHKK